MAPPPNRRELVLDNGRVFVDTPWSMMDEESPGHRSREAHITTVEKWLDDSGADARLPIEQLVEEETTIPVRVRGWQQQAYLHKDAAPGRKLEGSVLLSAFDPLIWHRPRTERLFGFRYRLEIYTPAHKREHGYYVLPFLLDGVLVARVDLKEDRKAGTLSARRARCAAIHGGTADRGASPDGVMARVVEPRHRAGRCHRPSLHDPPRRGPPGICRAGTRAIRDDLLWMSSR